MEKKLSKSGASDQLQAWFIEARSLNGFKGIVYVREGTTEITKIDKSLKEFKGKAFTTLIMWLNKNAKQYSIKRLDSGYN